MVSERTRIWVFEISICRSWLWELCFYEYWMKQIRHIFKRDERAQLRSWNVKSYRRKANPPWSSRSPGWYRLWWPRQKNWLSEGNQKVQTSSYKVSHGDIIYSTVTGVNNTVLHIWTLLRGVGLESSHHKRKMHDWEVVDVNQTSCDRFPAYACIALLYCTPETHVVCPSYPNFKNA